MKEYTLCLTWNGWERVETGSGTSEFRKALRIDEATSDRNHNAALHLIRGVMDKAAAKGRFGQVIIEIVSTLVRIETDRLAKTTFPFSAPELDSKRSYSVGQALPECRHALVLISDTIGTPCDHSDANGLMIRRWEKRGLVFVMNMIVKSSSHERIVL